MPAESVSCSVVSDSLQPYVAYEIHGILQARLLEWVAIPFTRGSVQPMDRTRVSHAVGRFFYYLSHQGSLDSKLKPVRLIWFSRGLPKEGAKDTVLYRTGATPKESQKKEVLGQFPKKLATVGKLQMGWNPHFCPAIFCGLIVELPPYTRTNNSHVSAGRKASQVLRTQEGNSYSWERKDQ